MKLRERNKYLYLKICNPLSAWNVLLAKWLHDHQNDLFQVLSISQTKLLEFNCYHNFYTISFSVSAFYLKSHWCLTKWQTVLFYEYTFVHPKIIKWWRPLMESVRTLYSTSKRLFKVHFKTRRNSVSMLVGQHPFYCPINLVMCQWLDQPYWKVNNSVPVVRLFYINPDTWLLPGKWINCVKYQSYLNQTGLISVFRALLEECLCLPVCY